MKPQGGKSIKNFWYVACWNTKQIRKGEKKVESDRTIRPCLFIVDLPSIQDLRVRYQVATTFIMLSLPVIHHPTTRNSRWVLCFLKDCSQSTSGRFLHTSAESWHASTKRRLARSVLVSEGFLRVFSFFGSDLLRHVEDCKGICQLSPVASFRRKHWQIKNLDSTFAKDQA